MIEGKRKVCFKKEKWTTNHCTREIRKKLFQEPSHSRNELLMKREKMGVSEVVEGLEKTTGRNRQSLTKRTKKKGDWCFGVVEKRQEKKKEL